MNYFFTGTMSSKIDIAEASVTKEIIYMPQKKNLQQQRRQHKPLEKALFDHTSANF